MNQIVKAEPRKPALTTGSAVAAMVPTDVSQAWRLSEIIAQSGMAPKSYGSDPAKIMVGMLAGMEIGLTPMVALQSIAVIGNNPSIWGDGALALVQSSNLIEDMAETDDGHTATCTIKRVGRASPITATFSMDDAKKAGLAGKSGPWTQYPRRMRQMRARLFALRDGFADVLKGLRMAEEVRDYADFADAPARPVQPMEASGGRALLEASLAEEEPEHDAETGEITEHEPRAESSSVSPDDADPGPVPSSSDDGSAPSSPDASEAGMRCEAALKAATTLADVQALRTDRQFKADMNWLHKNDAGLFEILAGMIKRLEGEFAEDGE